MSNLPPLTPTELTRYSRHIILPEVGLEGQQRLKAASVLLVGAGGLGSPAALFLAAAGVGQLGLVEFDTVEASNLHRQVLHGTSAVGRPKLESARERLADLNPHVELVDHPVRLDSSNALDILADYDVVVDGSDNFPTRYLVNDACVLAGKPNAYGSIFRFEGQASLFNYEKGPCYRCLFPQPPPPHLVPSCAEGGVLGLLPGLIGTIQATEAVKIILGKGRTLAGRLLLYDALNMDFREVRVPRNPDCPVCGDNPSVTELIDYEEFCRGGEAEVAAAGLGEATGETAGEAVGEAPSAPAATGAGEVSEGGEGPPPGVPLEPLTVASLLAGPDPPLLLDVREPGEWALCHIKGARLIPLGELSKRLGELDRRQRIVVYCHTGQRSALAVNLLQRHGLRKVHNLTGGIDLWALQMDPGMVRY